MSVEGKILAVMADVEYVKKDKRNEFHKYDYASDEAVLKVIRAALMKHRLLVRPSQSSYIRQGELTTIGIDYEITDIDSKERVTSRVYGEGKDSNDKGVYKAATGAEKYFLLKTFLIPTGDDPENEGNGKATNGVHRTVTPAPAPKAPVSVIASTDGLVIWPKQVETFKNKKPSRNGEIGFNYVIIDNAAERYRTFDKGIADLATQAADDGDSIQVYVEENNFGKTITGLAGIPDDVPEVLEDEEVPF